jgi:hypothetical protein
MGGDVSVRIQLRVADFKRKTEPDARVAADRNEHDFSGDDEPMNSLAIRFCQCPTLSVFPAFVLQSPTTGRDAYVQKRKPPSDVCRRAV